MNYLGVCAIIRDEDPFLCEWMAYYLHLGVTAFYLYDNGSRIPLRTSLAGFAGVGGAAVRVHESPGRAMQMVVYNHCLASYASECRWLAFVDLDEFIVPLQRDTIPAMLEEYESYGGVAFNWKIFGSGGHKLRPKGLQVENYTMALDPADPAHRHVKSVVDPARAKVFFNPHMCLMRSGSHMVTENCEPLETATTQKPSWHKGQVNHYYFRSKQDYHEKLQKPRADLFKTRQEVYTRPFEEGVTPDESAVRFVGGVRGILAGLEKFQG